MTKQELMENYTLEQLADMVVKYQNTLEMFKFTDVLSKTKLFDNPVVEAYETEIKYLKEQIEHYKYSMMQIDDVLVEFLGVTHEVMDKPSDFEKVLEEKISYYKDRIRELEMELEYKDGTKMFETLMENTDGEAKDLLAQHMYENLKCVRTNARMEDDVNITDLLPIEPIKVANMLISVHLYGTSQLRQIAQHLLIYCDANEKE